MQASARSTLALLAIVSTLATPAGKAQAAQATVLSDEWYATSILGKHVGYYHVREEQRLEAGRDVILRVEDWSFALKRMNTEIGIELSTTYVESVKGEPIRLESRNKLAAQEYTVAAVRRGEHFLVTQDSMGKKTETEIPYSPELIFPHTIEREILASAMTAGRKLVVKTLSPEYARPVRRTIECVGPEQVLLAPGHTERLVRFETSESMVPDIVFTEWRDTDGLVHKMKLPVAGIEIVSTRCTRDEALLPPESVEMLVSTLVDPGQYIPQPRHVDRAVFRLSLNHRTGDDDVRTGDDDARTLSIPEDERQRIIGRSNGAIVLEVKGENWKKDSEASPPRREYRTASTVLQTDDPRVRALARKAAPNGKNPAAIAQAISRWVYRAIDKKSLSVGLATASEVARDLEGDCTEHAVLAAALARARKVPSKVAMGLVYLNGVFGYHMWTEVWDDGWHAIDPALGQAATDATHIKLAESPLDLGFVDESVVGMIHLISSLDISIVEYEIDGKEFDAKSARAAGTIRNGEYKNTLFGIRMSATDGWRFVPGRASLKDGTLVLVEGPDGARGALRAQAVPRNFKLQTWVDQNLQAARMRKDRIISVAEKPGRAMLLGGPEPEAVVAFFDRQTLYTLRLKPISKRADHLLDDLVGSIRLESN